MGLILVEVTAFVHDVTKATHSFQQRFRTAVAIIWIVHRHVFTTSTSTSTSFGASDDDDDDDDDKGSERQSMRGRMSS